jgi:hypothetical protein
MVFQVIPLCCSTAGEYHRFGDICCILLQDEALDIIHKPNTLKTLSIYTCGCRLQIAPKIRPVGLYVI